MSDAQNEGAVAVADESDASGANNQGRLSLQVDITNSGPCRKRVNVVVAASDIDTMRAGALNEYVAKAAIPGFRPGRVPRRLVETKFKRELADDLKQRVLIQSLEQITKDHKIDPIDEPDMDFEALEIPESGDFSYSFEVEVRPDVAVPDLTAITLKRPVRTITDEDVGQYLDSMLVDYGDRTPCDGPAAAGDYVIASVTFEHRGAVAREMSEMSFRILPTLAFQDAEISGFGQLMTGVSAGDTREVEFTISDGAQYVPMRGETVKAVFAISAVQKFTPAICDHEFLDRLGMASEQELRDKIREILDRQVKHRQRQMTRDQLLEQITASAAWDLPEELVMKQVENALHREILEMRQAGFSAREIRARENELRRNSVASTRKAMKEHFILDRIATDEKVEVSSQELETEIVLMAFQSGESPRKLKARLYKTGVIENLEAQIRERKAVDIALDRAQYVDEEMTERLVQDLTVEAVQDAVCNVMFERAADEPQASDAN